VDREFHGFFALKGADLKTVKGVKKGESGKMFLGEEKNKTFEKEVKRVVIASECGALKEGEIQ